MDRDPQVLFNEAWEFAAKRVNAGKHSKDRIRFFLTDGTTKTFDIPPMQDDQMKEGFMEITLQAINNYHIEALLLSYEAWFVDAGEDVTEANINEYLEMNPRPQKHPKRREGVNFYYESADGIILNTLVEIVTVKKNKRELDKLSEITVVKAETRMSHFFQKAREYSKMYKNTVDDIIQNN